MESVELWLAGGGVTGGPDEGVVLQCERLRGW